MQAIGLERIEPPISGSGIAAFQRTRDAVSREVGGEMVVVPVCRGVGDLDSIYTFNAVGTLLWSLLEESCTEEELAAFVVRRFGLTDEAARADVRNFLADLQESGLLRSV